MEEYKYFVSEMCGTNTYRHIGEFKDFDSAVAFINGGTGCIISYGSKSSFSRKIVYET